MAALLPVATRACERTAVDRVARPAAVHPLPAARPGGPAGRNAPFAAGSATVPMAAARIARPAHRASATPRVPRPGAPREGRATPGRSDTTVARPRDRTRRPHEAARRIAAPVAVARPGPVGRVPLARTTAARLRALAAEAARHLGSMAAPGRTARHAATGGHPRRAATGDAEARTSGPGERAAGPFPGAARPDALPATADRARAAGGGIERARPAVRRRLRTAAP